MVKNMENKRHPNVQKTIDKMIQDTHDMQVKAALVPLSALIVASTTFALMYGLYQLINAIYG